MLHKSILRAAGWAVCVIAVLWLLLEAPLEEKIRSNPVGPDVNAIEFVAPGGGVIATVEDPALIAGLRLAHRWTNRHAYCCLGEPDHQPAAYAYFLAEGQSRAEPLPVFEELSVPGFNLPFRWLLRQAWQSLPEG